jgi:hypothetical protein
MTTDKNRMNTPLLRPMRLAVAVTLGVGLLAGCSGYEKLGQEALDEDYTVDGIRWTSGTTTLIFMKASNNQGKLAICGAYTASGHADLSGEAVRQFMGTASMYIGEERIGPMSFTNQISWPGAKLARQGDKIIVRESSESANCVKTGKDWNESYGKELIKFKGPSRITVQM